MTRARPRGDTAVSRSYEVPENGNPLDACEAALEANQAGQVFMQAVITKREAELEASQARVARLVAVAEDAEAMVAGFGTLPLMMHLNHPATEAAVALDGSLNRLLPGDLPAPTESKP